jgi:hypothetical protein
VANDTIDRMRELALKDMAEASPTVVPFVKRRAKGASGAPLIPRAREVLRVRVTGKVKDGVEVELRNGTYRARGMPASWVPVVVAMLTGRELVPVRRAIRTGVTEFERTGTE